MCIRDRDCCSQIPVRGDDGARAVGAIDDDDDDVGFGFGFGFGERRQVAQLRGHRQRSPNSAALTVGRLAKLSPRCAGCGSERSVEFGSVTHPRCPYARAHNRETRRLLTNRPGSNFSTESPIDVYKRQALAIIVAYTRSGRSMMMRRRVSAARYGVIDSDRQILQH